MYSANGTVRGIGMAESMTFEQVEALAAQLPPRDQLKLVERISGRLSVTMGPVVQEGPRSDEVCDERMRLAEELLAEVEDIEDDSQGDQEAAERIQRMRDQRVGQVCQSRV
jgi:hypothetical protein